MARIDDTMSKMQNLWPTNFDLKQLDKELACMAMIWALPEEYANFTSSILLLGTLSKSALQDTFYAEEMNCKHCMMESSNTNTENALFTKVLWVCSLGRLKVLLGNEGMITIVQNTSWSAGGLRGVPDIGFSLCAVPTYCLVSEYFMF